MFFAVDIKLIKYVLQSGQIFLHAEVGILLLIIGTPGVWLLLIS